MRGWLSIRGMPGGRVRLRHDVYFVRHGATDWNLERRKQGHCDVPLNEIGREQARRNGVQLHHAVKQPNRLAFISSPLRRATETLEIIRECMSLPARRYTIDDRIIEMDLGSWQGKTDEEVTREDPTASKRVAKDKWNFRVPDGESYAETAVRVRDFLCDLRMSCVIVGHGWTGKVLRGYLLGLKRDCIASLKCRHDVVYKISRGKEASL